MAKKYPLSIITLLIFSLSWSQSEAYEQKKAKKIADGSVFTKIINREVPAIIEYEDDDVIAFIPRKAQAPIHLLIVPKKEIHTMNNITREDTMLIGKLFLVAKKLAKEKGIDKTGYRLSINTNEDAGQSVFHLHLHLYGGEMLPPMLPRKKEK